MRFALFPPSLLPLLLLLVPTIKAITLTDFQPINGFSSQCTQAYNTPLQGCTQSDFQSGHACSPDCITFLEALTKMLNTDCKGTSAFPNTLIGLFFSQQGTSTLCPNVLGSSGGGGGDQASYGSAASPGRPSTSAESQHMSSVVIASKTSASLIIPSSSGAPSSSSANPTSSDATSSTTVVLQTTITPTHTPGNIISSTGSASSIAPASSKTSSASDASSTGKEADAGGGTILDLGSTSVAPPSSHFNARFWAMLCVLVMLA